MYLGLDLGTSGVKALIIDANQKVVASAQGHLEVSRPHAGWSEQDPAAWIRATETALDALHASHGAALSAVEGIGLSGQMPRRPAAGNGETGIRLRFACARLAQAGDRTDRALVVVLKTPAKSGCVDRAICIRPIGFICRKEDAGRAGSGPEVRHSSA